MDVKKIDEGGAWAGKGEADKGVGDKTGGKTRWKKSINRRIEKVGSYVQTKVVDSGKTLKREAKRKRK